MCRHTVACVLVGMMFVLPVMAQDADDADPATVTMSAEQWTAAQVAAELEEQAGIQVAVTDWTEGSVTGTLEDFTVEEAVSSLGQATTSSWVRFYMLESAPPAEPYS